MSGYTELHRADSLGCLRRFDGARPWCDDYSGDVCEQLHISQELEGSGRLR
jgi:hypothetical protein